MAILDKLLLMATLLAVPLSNTAMAQQVGPTLSPSESDSACPPTSAGDEIVICGRRDDGTRYRIPSALRDAGPIPLSHMSHAARMRDLASVSRYDAQSVGPGGYLQRTAQASCEWVAARQAAQGRQIDCTRKNRGDAEDDWTRGTDAAR